MSTVRRRVAETVRPLSEISGEELLASHPRNVEEEEERAAAIQSLIDEGTRLFETSKESGFQELAKLAQGLKFLAAAAGKGSDEAIERLQTFFFTPQQVGLSSVMEKLPMELVSVMKVMVGGSETEKQIYKVASEIFSTMAVGASVILEDEIDSAAEQLLKSEQEVVGVESAKSVRSIKKAVWRLLHCSVITDEDGKEVVTQESFCAIACMYARGELILPLEAHESDDIMSYRQKEFQQANVLKKVIDFPAMTMSHFGQVVLKTIEKHGVRWMWSFVSLKQLYFLALVYLLPMVNASFVLSTLATLTFFGSFIAMAISTLQVIARSTRVSRFKEYSMIFRYFSDHPLTINTHKVEVKFMRNLAAPYLTLGIALLLSMLTIELAFQQLVVYELLAIVAGLLVGAVAVHFQFWNSPIIVIALLSRLVSWADVFLHLLNEVIPLPEIAFLLGRQIVGIPIFPGFSLGISLTTLIQVPVHFAVIVHLLIHHAWYNLFAGVGPYFVCMSWWLFCKYLVSHSSLTFLAIVVFGSPCLLILAPLLPLIILLAPILHFIFYGFTVKLLVTLVVVLLIACAALAITFYYRQLKEARWLNKPFEYLVLANVVLCAIGLVVGSSYFDNQHSSTSLPCVSLEHYSQLCGSEHWKETGNMLQTQLSCLHLQGRVLQGEARIQSVTISQIFNSKVAFVDRLPNSVRTAFVCLMGTTDPMCGRNADAQTCVSRGCHFDASNKYLVNISVELLAENEQLPVAADMTISFDHEHLQESVLVQLRKRDRVRFNATLEAGMGSDHVVLKLKSAFVNGTNYSFADRDEDRKDMKQFALSSLMGSVQSSLLLVFEIIFGYSN